MILFIEIVRGIVSKNISAIKLNGVENVLKEMIWLREADLNLQHLGYAA
jgi:hypothetical protein